MTSAFHLLIILTIIGKFEPKLKTKEIMHLTRMKLAYYVLKTPTLSAQTGAKNMDLIRSVTQPISDECKHVISPTQDYSSVAKGLRSDLADVFQSCPQELRGT